MPSLIMRRKLNDFNILMETWKYDFIKNVKNRFDKSSLALVRYIIVTYSSKLIRKLGKFEF